MKNDLENEVNEKKSNNTTTGFELTTYHNAKAAYQWAMWTYGESGVELQYKLAKHTVLI